MAAQQLLEREQPTAATTLTSKTEISESAIVEIAQQYCETHIDPTFKVASADYYYNAPLMREMWHVILRCEDGPLGILQVEPGDGQVIPLSEDAIRTLREKALIYAARKQGILPMDEDGYVLREYARRRAEEYLGDNIGMFFGAKEPVFVSCDTPLWQLTIYFKMQSIGPFTLGTLDVDAHTGAPIALTEQQITELKQRTHDIVDHRTQATAA